MSGIREGMPVLAATPPRRHRSHLQCKFPDDGPYAYHQINTYIWDDGRKEEIHFPQQPRPHLALVRRRHRVQAHLHHQASGEVNPVHAHMPALVRHAAVWEGTYRTVTTDGVEVDRHASRLEVSFPDDGPYAYVQKNRFTWPDGRVVEAEHPGVYRDGRLWWDTGLIQGSAWQGDDRTCTLTWQRADAPGVHLYELIVIAADGLTRARTWHWFRDGVCWQRTLIDERRI